jgi:hypothetical protein
LAYSLTNVGGKAGMVARFFAGPWGSILIAAATIIGSLALASDKAAQSQEDLGDMADYVGRAQSQLGKVIDLITGKWTSQNVVLREAIRLQAVLAQQQAQKTANEAGQRLAGQISGPHALSILPGFGQAYRAAGATPTQGAAEFSQLVANYKANANSSFTQFRQSLQAMADSGRLKGIDINAALTDALRIAAARGDYKANQDIQRVIDGGPLPDYLRKTAKAKKPRKAPKPKDPFGLQEFGRDAADRIENLTKGFSDTPAQVEKVNSAIKQLDDLLDDIQHKKPPNMKELLADGERARDIIKDGINKPFNDFILDQQKSLDVARLITAGRYDEANALQIIQQLEKSMGPLTAERKDQVLATVQALREEARQAEIIRQKQQKYLDLLGEVKDAVKGIIADPIQGLKDLPKKMIGAISQFRTEKVFESLFGDAFRDLEDKITGNKTAKDAAERMAVAVDKASAANDNAARAVSQLADSAQAAANAVAGLGQSAYPAGGGVDPLAPNPADGDAIVVTGKRPTDLGGILQSLAKGVGLSDNAAKSIGTNVAKGFGGAATGAMVQTFLKPLGKMLGIKTSSTGAQIGGAIGSFIPIPGGDIIGSIIGSIVGGLFKKNKKGSATITNAYDAPTAHGNFKSQTTALAESIQGGILNIANALGGELGNFAVSIGYNKKKDSYVVDETGQGKLKTGAGKDRTIEFKTQEEAVMYAILDAIADGAVKGLSPAVEKALKSNKDLDKAVSEALKVQQLEDLIGGIGGSLSRVFKQFDAEAADRVRVAKAYGLDLVKVEQINGEQRAKLLDDLLKSRLGALQDLQKSLLYGDDFEGDAGTRRSAILDQIQKVTADAEKGVEGANDQLADLYQQLIDTSKEAYGTAGSEYTSDRDLVTSGLDHIIQIEKDRIEAAAAYQQQTLDAANTNNALTNETNDLLAGVNGRLDSLVSVLTGGGGGGTARTGLSPLLRVARL